MAAFSESLTDKMARLHRAFHEAGLAHAFGGALALGWCTGNGRGTVDINVNVFVAADQVDAVRAALPAGVTRDDTRLKTLARDGQARLDWQGTPLDIFLNTTEIHAEAARRVRWEILGGNSLPFLSCFHLALFKAFFNRAKDWADLEAMRDAGTLDVARLQATLAHHLGEDDERITSLGALA